MAKQRHRRVLIPALALFSLAAVWLHGTFTSFVAPQAVRSAQVREAKHSSKHSQGKITGDPAFGSFIFEENARPSLSAAADPVDESSSLVALAATALAAVASANGDALSSKHPQRSSWMKMFDAVKLPVFVMLWYFFNVQYNIVNKKLLKCFSATWAVSCFQLASGIPIAFLMWNSGAVRKPKLSGQDLMKLAPVGLAFAIGQAATVASLGAVAVSFAHVVKALEPAVNAMASALILGQVFHPVVYASLVPIFLGVALASANELSFNMFGFLAAMASNFAFVTRNVLATKLGGVGDMGDDQTTRKTNQLCVLTMVAFLAVLPIAYFMPGGLLAVPDAWRSAVAAGVPAKRLLYLLVSSSFYFFMYQLSSFWVLSCVQPMTHSVLNTLKRVVIIVMSIFVFQNPVTTQSAIGTATAIGGVLLYSLTKAFFGKKSK